MEEAVRTRRAVRRFKPESAPREVLSEVLALAHLSPSSYNLQPWHFVVVDEPALKKRLRWVAMDQAHVENAPAGWQGRRAGK